MKHLRISGSILALTALMVAPAYAQLTDEIVVTATKKSTNLQDTAVSITAYSGESIRDLGFENSTAIAAQTPGLNVGTPVGEGNNPSFTLRGVGLNDFNDNNEGPIAVYTDEVYNAALPGLTFQLYDVERVEVLRGPQGTLYGRNATGGLLHFISKRGGEEFEGDVRAQYGRFDAIEVEGGFGGPIEDVGHFRVSGKFSNSDGYVENRIGNDSNEADSISVRGIADFDIGEKSNIEFKLDYNDADTRAPFYQHTVTGSFGPTDRFGYVDTDDDNFASDIDGDDNVLEIETYGASVNFKHDFGNVQLTNIAAFRDVEKLHQEDTDTGPFNGIEASFASQHTSFSNELRFAGETGPLSWVVGGFYLNTQVDGQLGLEINDVGTGFIEFLDTIPGDEGGFLDPDAGGLLELALDINGISFADFGAEEAVRFLTYDVDYTQNTDSFSVFANVEYDVTESLQIVAGGRYSNESRDIEYVNAFGDGPVAGGALNAVVRDVVGAGNYFDFRTGASNLNFTTFEVEEVGDLNQLDEDDLSGTFGVNYTLADGTLLYGKVAQGFKAGGFNAGFLDLTDGVLASDIRYDNEKLTSFEGGVKWTSPGGRIRVNASGFYYIYDDYQALTFSGLSQFIQNTDGTFFGGEAELGATIVDGLTVTAGASYLDTELDEVSIRNPLDGSLTLVQDVETVLAPSFTANGVIRYETEVGNGVGSIQGSFNHQGSHFFDLQNTNEEGSYTLFDARAGYSFGADSQYELFVFGKNLSDEEYRVYSFNFDAAAGFQQEFFGRPREYGGGILAKF